MKEQDWAKLSFGYLPTDYNVRCYYRNGKWGEIEVCSDEYIKLHMAATCLHYGQEAFEGLKAYRCPDGKVRVFRVEENAARHLDARSSDRNVHGNGEEGGASQSGIYPNLREWGNALRASFAYRNGRTSGRSPVERIFVHDLCHARRPLFQRRFLGKSLCHYSRLRPFGTAGYGCLQGRRQLCGQLEGQFHRA